MVAQGWYRRILFLPDVHPRNPKVDTAHDNQATQTTKRTRRCVVTHVSTRSVSFLRLWKLLRGELCCCVWACWCLVWGCARACVPCAGVHLGLRTALSRERAPRMAERRMRRRSARLLRASCDKQSLIQRAMPAQCKGERVSGERNADECEESNHAIFKMHVYAPIRDRSPTPCTMDRSRIMVHAIDTTQIRLRPLALRGSRLASAYGKC
jgi:hypothetical protein